MHPRDAIRNLPALIFVNTKGLVPVVCGERRTNHSRANLLALNPGTRLGIDKLPEWRRGLPYPMLRPSAVAYLDRPPCQRLDLHGRPSKQFTYTTLEYHPEFPRAIGCAFLVDN